MSLLDKFIELYFFKDNFLYAETGDFLIFLNNLIGKDPSYTS